MRIVLLGYMASGKSSIGKKISKDLNTNLIDLDDYIIEKEKMSISEIFSEKGEIYFRKIEHKYLKEILENFKEAFKIPVFRKLCFSTFLIFNRTLEFLAK